MNEHTAENDAHPKCPYCGHIHGRLGCRGMATPADLWAGVTPAACDCDTVIPPEVGDQS